jgi:hypothetical protein
MSATRDQDYLCEGIAEELINVLTRCRACGWWHGAPRSSSKHRQSTCARWAHASALPPCSKEASANRAISCASPSSSWTWRTGTGVMINVASLYARLGMKEEALELLERRLRGSGKRDWIEHDSDYDSLGDDPRFQGMLQKLK